MSAPTKLDAALSAQVLVLARQTALPGAVTKADIDRAIAVVSRRFYQANPQAVCEALRDKILACLDGRQSRSIWGSVFPLTGDTLQDIASWAMTLVAILLESALPFEELAVA